MAIDGILLSAVKHNLETNLLESRINKIYQPEKHLLTLSLRQPGESFELLISNHSQRGRVHLTELSFKNPPHPPDFCMLLRKYLINGKITNIKQPEFERVLYMEIQNHNKIFYLILEIMGKYSNAILIDKDRTVLDAMKRISKEMNRERQLYPGIEYQAPPPQDKLNPLKVDKDNFFQKIPENFEDECYKAIMYNFRGIGPNMAREIIYRVNMDYNKSYSKLNENEKQKIWQGFNNIFSMIINNSYSPTIGLDDQESIDYTSAFELTYKNEELEDTVNFNNTKELFDYYYEKEVKNKEFNELNAKLLNTVDNYLKKNEKQQRKFRGMIKDSKNAKEYQKKGELLKANISKIKNAHKKKIKVTNFYDPEQKEITINIDPEKSPGENIERYFKKYDNAFKIRKNAKKELGKLVHEEKYLEQVKLNIEQAENIEELEEIEQELIEEGYIEKQNRNSSKRNKPLPPLKFKSSQGYDIIVGRNSKQNDYITKKVAKSHDIWVHTKEIPGSHVIIRNHTRKEIPEKTIKEAAILAASFSKAKMSENVPVDYTQIKNVNKPKGARPGLVYYDEYQTMYVDPDQELVKKLKQ